MKCDIISLQVDARELDEVDAFAKKANIGRHAAARFLLNLGIDVAKKPTTQAAFDLRKGR
jgi:hypothetical protein